MENCFLLLERTRETSWRKLSNQSQCPRTSTAIERSNFRHCQDWEMHKLQKTKQGGSRRWNPKLISSLQEFLAGQNRPGFKTEKNTKKRQIPWKKKIPLSIWEIFACRSYKQRGKKFGRKISPLFFSSFPVFLALVSPLLWKNLSDNEPVTQCGWVLRKKGGEQWHALVNAAMG